MSYFSVLLYLLRHKKYLFIPFIVGLICFGIAWLMPPYYKTEIRVQINSPQSSSLGSISSMLGGSGKKSSSMGMVSSLSNILSSKTGMTESDLYMEILSGRDVALETIHAFRLDTIYKKKYDELLLKRFNKDIIIAEEDNDIISCGFEAKDKEMARDLVRFMVNKANDRYLSLQKDLIHYSMDYLKQSESDLKDSVRTISEELVAFYRDNNLVDLETQLKLTLSTLSGYETQINNYRMTEQSQGDNGEANELRKKRAILEKKFKELRGRYNEKYVPSEKSLYVNSDWAVSKTLYEKMRKSDLEMYSSLLEIVSAEILSTESERLKQQPVIQVIQDAYLPDWKSRPKRATWAVVGFGISGAVILVYLLFMGMVSGEIVNSFDVKGKFDQIKASLRK